MPWPRFVLFNAIGAAVWVAVWSVAGYLAGDHWAAISAVVHRYEPYAIGVIAAGVLIFVVVRMKRQAGRGKRPA
jgi:membrane protein DedA with SNARE-associated domain